MSKEISSEPISSNFYIADKWLPNLLTFYADEKKLLPREALEGPLFDLADAIETILMVNQNHPDVAYRLLGQDIDPLFMPEEYREKIYKAILDLNDIYDFDFLPLADAELLIRSMFEQDTEYLQEKFSKEINMLEENNLKDKTKKFTKIMQKITKIHVRQVMKMLENR